MRTARLLAKLAGGLLLGVLLAVALFLLASMVGALVPRSTPVAAAQAHAGEIGERVTIHLLSGLLHTDIVLPANEKVRARFPELMKTRLPMANPRLTNLSFGWGSKAFYTTAGTYGDVRISTAWTAATGDTSVIRVVGLPDLPPAENVSKVELTAEGFDRLLEAIAGTFDRDGDGKAKYLPEFSIGQPDAFFSARGYFHLFNPCNQWTGEMLATGDVATGRWTPTTFSLLWSLDWHSGSGSL